jgi:hypothetical protein
MQFHDTDSISSEGKWQQNFSKFLKYTGSVLLLIWGLLILFSGGFTGVLAGLVQIAAAGLFFLYIHDISWKISNSIREFVMPSGYVAHDFGDAFRKKIFWYVGPQSFGWLVAIAVLSLPGMYASENKNSINNNTTKTDDSSRSVNSQNNNLNEQPAEVSSSAQTLQIPTVVQTETATQKIYTKEEVEQMEKEKQYSGDDAIIRQRLGLPPKPQ